MYYVMIIIMLVIFALIFSDFFNSRKSNNQKRKTEYDNTIIGLEWIIGIAIVIAILSPIIVYSFKKGDITITNNIILYLGTILGSIISVCGAVLAVLFTLKKDKVTRQTQINEEFIRIYHSLINSLSLANIVMEILTVNKGGLISDEPMQKEKDLKKYLGHLERYSADIEKIDENKLPLNFIKDFYEVKRIISTFSFSILPTIDKDKLEKLSEQEQERILKMMESQIKSHMLKEHQKVETFINKFNEYAEKVLNDNI